jgi:hypothetical protein
MSKEATAYVVVISLMEIQPAIWRRLIVPASISLKQLHVALQTAMGWSNYHLHQFETQVGRFGTPDPDYPDGTLNEARVRLDRFLCRVGDRIEYEYDFGDGWVHELRLEKIIGPVDGDVAVECVDGARACPPEDVGGPHGYMEFLRAIRDRAHPDHARMVEWIGGKFDSERFDAKAVNRALSQRRRGA